MANFLPIENKSIPATPPKETSLDFARIRQEGLDQVTRFSKKIWTDYNAHDPGITILEVLSMAITEVGLKINQEIEDLITSATGPTDSLFDVAQILSGAPLTPEDYRKILIDHPQIRNAWMTPLEGKSEVSFFFNESEQTLDYSGGNFIAIKGLYEILIEFENETLNTNVISRQVTSGTNRDYDIDIVFPYWDQLESKVVGTEALILNSSTALEIPGDPGVRLQSRGEDEYFSLLDVTYTTQAPDEIPIFIRVIPSIDPADLAEFEDQDPNNNPILELLEVVGPGSVLSDFNEKNNTTRQAVDQVIQYLHTYRNLCEDFLAFRTVRTQEIAVTADIELHPESDVVETLAEILFQLDRFLAPIISFSSFEEMEKDRKVDEVYEGPLLENGFIDRNQFNLDERFDVDDGEQIIYTSDIIRLLKNLNGTDALPEGSKIQGIKNLSLSNYINNIEITRQARNCLKLTQSTLYKPKFGLTKSVLKVSQSGLAINVDAQSVITRYNEKLTHDVDALQTFPVNVLFPPEGETLKIEDYWSIQYDFPAIYRLKAGESSLLVMPDERGKVKQLKGYLLFFEQLLANYLAQLSHLNELFAINPTNPKTYFSLPLTQVPEVGPLMDPGYAANLPDIVESDPVTRTRRNQFLDHILARHSENPADFRALNSFYLNLDPGQQPTNIDERLMEVKRIFLADYPDLSAKRGLGFHYLLQDGGTPDVWDTDNVSGFQKRLARLLGIENYNQRTLHTISTGNAPDGEGLHVIEHLLLRPKNRDLGDALLSPKVGNNVYPDPYSFIVTIVFPSGFERDFATANSVPTPLVEASRFQFENFRIHTQQLIRRELPAHVLFHLLWLDRDTDLVGPDPLSLNQFENNLQAFLEAVADEAVSPNDEVLARTALIDTLNAHFNPADE